MRKSIRFDIIEGNKLIEYSIKNNSLKFRDFPEFSKNIYEIKNPENFSKNTQFCTILHSNISFQHWKVRLEYIRDFPVYVFTKYPFVDSILSDKYLSSGELRFLGHFFAEEICQG